MKREWQGCQLVNPLCPDDLCVLPYQHDGWHLLYTMVEPGPVSEIMHVVDDGVRHRMSTLYRMGVEEAERRWPSDANR